MRVMHLAKSDRDAFLWLLQGPGLRPAAIYFFAQLGVLLTAIITAALRFDSIRK